jgi:hypothetical protein
MIESTTILGRTRKYGDTIVAFRRPVEPLTALSTPIPDEDLKDVQEEVDDLLKIRFANSMGRRGRASYLIQRRYAWRGYSTPPLEGDPSVQVTLSAFDKEHTVATMTVGLDSPQGMYVAGLFGDEVAKLRDEGKKLCEFTKLAVAETVRSNPVLGAIFHIAFIYAIDIHQCTDLLIEVSPRHVNFYRRMLGFTKVGVERFDPRVHSPAVLLRLDLQHCANEIARVGGLRDQGRVERSFYPYCFPPQEAVNIEQRLRDRG